MKDSEFFKDENPQESWNLYPPSQKSLKTVSERPNQPRDLLTSHESPQTLPIKDTFDHFITKFPDTLYFFAQNQKTSFYVNDDDINTMIEAKRTRNDYVRRTYSLTLALNIFGMRTLNEGNKIFGLTQRVTTSGMLLKYFFVPFAVRETFDLLFYYPQYRQTYQKIQKKYNFIDPIFMDEYAKDPDPQESIRLFLESRSKKPTQNPSYPGEPLESSEQKQY